MDRPLVSRPYQRATHLAAADASRWRRDRLRLQRGKRSLAQTTSFDVVARLRIAAASQLALIEDAPLAPVANGRPLRERMAKARVGDRDILASARQLQGLERMDQIKYAVLERSGGISIVPKQAE